MLLTADSQRFDPVHPAIGNASRWGGANFYVYRQRCKPWQDPLVDPCHAVVTSPMIRLDQAIDFDCWLLKLDVQGYELHALEGATTTARAAT